MMVSLWESGRGPGLEEPWERYDREIKYGREERDFYMDRDGVAVVK